MKPEEAAIKQRIAREAWSAAWNDPALRDELNDRLTEADREVARAFIRLSKKK
jgi:hypothetical protein